MHFATLIAVEVPHVEEDEQYNAFVAKQLEALKEKAESTPESLMARLSYRSLRNRATSFAQLVNDAVDDVMAPFDENSEDPRYCEFEDYTEELQDRYKTDTVDCARLPDGKIVALYSHEFCSKYKYERAEGIIWERNAGDSSATKRVRRARGVTLLKDYPIQKLYRTLDEYAETEGYCRDEHTGRYGYLCNPNGWWDWYCIGGRWPSIFLVSKDCSEYAPGESDFEEGVVPEGYMWVSAARKKDIAWDAMYAWRKQCAIKRFDELTRIFATKEKPEDFWGEITDEGISDRNGALYIDGETVEEYLRRRNIFDDDHRYMGDRFYNYIDAGEWHSVDEYGFRGMESKDNRDKWNDEIHSFIDGLSDETVLVVVDHHN